MSNGKCEFVAREFNSLPQSKHHHVPPYLRPSSSGIANDIAFLVHDLNPSRGLQTSGRKNIQRTDLGCGLKKRTQQRCECQSSEETSFLGSSLFL